MKFLRERPIMAKENLMRLTWKTRGEKIVSGFTLIEVLVVIVVMAILPSLLLPALSWAKEKAKAMECLNHARQLAVAWTMYADDNHGELAPNYGSIDDQGVSFGWVAGHMGRRKDATNTALVMHEDNSLVVPYMETPRVFKCPGDLSINVRSYAMNCGMGSVRTGGLPGWVGGYGTNYVVFHSISEIRDPAKMIVILDERSDSINDAYFAIDMSNTGNPEGEGLPNPYYIIDYPASYHNDSSSLSFSDGHAELHKWWESTTLVPLGEARPRIHTSNKDRDMTWLQARSSYRDE